MGDCLTTCSLSVPCSPGQNCGQSLCRSLGGAAAEAPWGTGAWRSWAGPLCGNAAADCYSSHCGSRCPGRPRRCPGHLELPWVTQDDMRNLSLPGTSFSMI